MNELALTESPHLPAIRLDSFLAEWLDELRQRVEAEEISPDTLAAYESGARKFLGWLQGQAPDGQAIRTWKADLLKANNRPASINTWLAGVRSFFGWLADTQQIPFNPAKAIKGATRKSTKKRHVRQPLTDQEMRRLLAAPDRTTPTGKRDYAILTLLAFTAMRGIELHRADLGDLQTQSGRMVLMVQGKGRSDADDMVVLPPTAETAVRDYLGIRKQKPGPLFVSLSNRSSHERLSRRALRQIVKDYFEAAGVHGASKTTHSLRHTAITNAIRHGVPVQKVQGMSRHASLETLGIYVHETDRIDDPAENYIDYGIEEATRA